MFASERFRAGEDLKIETAVEDRYVPTRELSRVEVEPSPRYWRRRFEALAPGLAASLPRGARLRGVAPSPLLESLPSPWSLPDPALMPLLPESLPSPFALSRLLSPLPLPLSLPLLSPSTLPSPSSGQSLPSFDPEPLFPEPEPEPLEPLVPETEESSVGKEAAACLLRRPPEPELLEPDVLCSSLPLGPRCGFAVRFGREAELCEATAESRASDVCCGPALDTGGAFSTLTASILTSLTVTSCLAASPPEG